jgi:hypothetical protein
MRLNILGGGDHKFVVYKIGLFYEKTIFYKTLLVMKTFEIN